MKYNKYNKNNNEDMTIDDYDLSGDDNISDDDSINNENNNDFNYDDIDDNLSGGNNDNREDDENDVIINTDTNKQTSCLYNLENYIDEFEPVEVKKTIIKDEDRITDPVLTRYEYVRILSDRTAQLAKGAKPMIKGDIKKYSSFELAQLELKHKVLPFIILRPLPNSKIEKWFIRELHNPYENKI